MSSLKSRWPRPSGRLLSVVAQSRFRTPMMRVKRLIEQGAAGRILHAQVNSWWWRGSSYYDLWWRGTWASEGGGCTLNHAVHQIDLLLWMRGMPVEVLAAIANTNHDNSEVEDLAVAILRHGDGTLSQVTASLVHHGEEQELMFQGEKAGLWVPWRVKAGKSKENGFPVDDPETVRLLEAWYASLPAEVHEGHAGQVADLLAAIESGRRPLVDGTEGRKTVELITAIYKAAVSGARVALPLASADPFYTAAGMVERMPRFHAKRRSVEGFTDTAITLGRDLR
jgi:UDP-N-acetyl-2-amino-2-deoxyglucuronate dehydrogenase